MFFLVACSLTILATLFLLVETAGGNLAVHHNLKFRRPACLVCVFVFSGCATLSESPSSDALETATIPVDRSLAASGLDPRVFRSGFARGHQGRLHYIRGGEGTNGTVVLLPGWPETWYAWRKMMPELAETHDVIAFDPPGLGSSDLVTDYDTGSVSDDITNALSELGVDAPYHVVAHDVGTWIAYTHVLDHPNDVRSVVFMDAAVPGLNLEDAFTLSNAPRLFQFFFNAVEDLPETLTEGRERQFLEFFFNSKSLVAGAVTPADVDVYLDTYTQPARMSAGFDYYRAVPQNSRENAGRELDLPVLALGAQSGVKDGLVKALRQGPAPQAQGGEVAGCGHYMPEECSDELLERIRSFWSRIE